VDDARDEHESKLIDRLASTTTSLRNLFYANLILASAVLFLVCHDPGFVSEKIQPALQTFGPIFKVYDHMKENSANFKDYWQNLDHTLELTHAAALTLDQKGKEIENMEEAKSKALEAKIKKPFNEAQMDALDYLVRNHKDINNHLNFEGDLKGNRDLKVAVYDDVFDFAAFLYPDYWLPVVEKMRDLLIQVDDLLPGALPNHQEVAGMNLLLLSLERYNSDKLNDSALTTLLGALPPPNKFYESAMVIQTFCTANGLGECSFQDIEKWQAKQDAEAPGKLGTAGIEVKVTRQLIVPASPIILLISQHLFIMLFRRREALRQTLSTGLSRISLNLLDDPWIPDNISLNTSSPRSQWRRAQSLLMTAFLFIGETAPLVAIGAVAYYTRKQVVLGAVTARDFAIGMADFKAGATKIGVSDFPSIPEVPGVFSEYVWFAVSVVCGLILLISLVQLIRDQSREVFLAE